MSESLHIGKTTITVTDDEFANGIQTGYLHFKADFQRIAITDQLIYTVMMQNIVDVHHQGRCNAGYLFGWICALLEGQTEHHVHLVRVLPLPAARPEQSMEG